MPNYAFEAVRNGEFISGVVITHDAKVCMEKGITCSVTMQPVTTKKGTVATRYIPDDMWHYFTATLIENGVTRKLTINDFKVGMNQARYMEFWF